MSCTAIEPGFGAALAPILGMTPARFVIALGITLDPDPELERRARWAPAVHTVANLAKDDDPRPRYVRVERYVDGHRCPPVFCGLCGVAFVRPLRPGEGGRP
jgi:hypothetical protein